MYTSYSNQSEYILNVSASSEDVIITSASSSPSQNVDFPSPTPYLMTDIPSSSRLHPAFSVNNIKNSIPILLDRDYGHYASWVELFRLHASVYNVLDHIEDAIPRPSTVDDPTWKLLDVIVKQWIYATISQDLLQAIMQPGVSAKELWACLVRIFQPMKLTHIQSLLSNLSSTRFENFLSMELYCERLEELFNQLASSRGRMSEPMRVHRLISGLTNKYDAVVAQIRQADPPLSYEEVRSRLVREETQPNPTLVVPNYNIE